MSYLLQQDGLNGKSGKAFITIDGRNVELFGLKKFESNAEIQKADFPVVGTKIIQQKPTGVKYSGTATVYYGTPDFIAIASQYQKTGILPEITFQVTNYDESSSVGTQTVAYYGVVLDKIPLSLLDDSADYLEEEISFTFSSFEELSAFRAPTNLGGSTN